MTDEQRQRVHAITYSCDDRAELAERIVALEDENKNLRDKNMLRVIAKRGIRACYDNLSEQYKELEAENAKLREYATKLEQTNDQLSNDNCDLLCDTQEMQLFIDENAKLRELVLCLLTYASNSDDACDKCPVNGGSGIWDFADFCDSLLDRVRELRIEVDA